MSPRPAGRPPRVDVETAVLALRGPVAPAEVRALAERLAGRLHADAVVEVGGTVDVGVVDVLARLALVARRRGVRLRVRADEGLAGLLALVGLRAVVQPLGEPEAGEQRGVEEVVDVLDPPA